MAAGKWKVFEPAKVYLADGTMDLNTNTFKVALFLSTSNCNTLSLGTLAALTNQHANANGYTTGGITVTPTYTQTGGTATFDTTDPVWTASGGSIVARSAVIYQSGVVNGVTDALLAVCLLDVTPADVTATPPNTLTVAMNALGLFTLAGAAVD